MARGQQQHRPRYRVPRNFPWDALEAAMNGGERVVEPLPLARKEVALEPPEPVDPLQPLPEQSPYIIQSGETPVPWQVIDFRNGRLHKETQAIIVNPDQNSPIKAVMVHAIKKAGHASYIEFQAVVQPDKRTELAERGVIAPEASSFVPLIQSAVFFDNHGLPLEAARLLPGNGTIPRLLQGGLICEQMMDTLKALATRVLHSYATRLTDPPAR